MYLEIVTPDKSVFSGEINSVQLPGAAGSFEILPNHAPVVSILEKGSIRIKTQEDEDIYYQIDGGVIEMTNNKIIVLAEMFY
jgi:F-type H+-transporting ATPase subunit epsilon